MQTLIQKLSKKTKAVNKWILVLLVCPLLATSQVPDSTYKVNKKRLKAVTIGGTVAYGAALVGLSQLWYADSESQPFQFFNDNPEWKQVDKFGHFFSGFYLSYGASRALRWCNVKPKQSDLVGSLVGFGVMLPIEILDGYSEAYGASAGDLLANAAGAAFFLGQSRLWNEIRIYPKFSFHRTHYADLRPDVLGNDIISEIFKDYNGADLLAFCRHGQVHKISALAKSSSWIWSGRYGLCARSSEHSSRLSGTLSAILSVYRF